MTDLPVMSAGVLAARFMRITMEDHSPRQIIKGFRAIEEKTGRSRPQLWRDIRSGTFPAPIKIGPNSVGFFADEVAAWLDARPRVNYAPRTARRTDTAA